MFWEASILYNFLCKLIKSVEINMNSKVLKSTDKNINCELCISSWIVFFPAEFSAHEFNPYQENFTISFNW